MDRLHITVLAILFSPQFAISALPKDFTVASYNVNLTVTKPVTFALVPGNVTINLVCQSNTSSISLNWGLSLTPARPSVDIFLVQLNDNDHVQAVNVTKVVPNLDTNVVTLHTNTTFAVNNTVAVTAYFETVVNTARKGLFQIKYPIQNDTDGYIIASHTIPTYAREIFPCLDDPSFPAIVNLTLTYPTGWQAATSLPVIASSTNDFGYTTSTFYSAAALPLNAFALFLANELIRIPYSDTRSETKFYFWVPKGFPDAGIRYTVQELTSTFHHVENLLGISLAPTNLNVVLLPNLVIPSPGYGIVYIRLFSNVDSLNALGQFIRQFTEFSTRPSSWGDFWLSKAIAGFLRYTLLNSLETGLDLKTEIEVVIRQKALSLDTAGSIFSRALEEPSIDTSSTAFLEAMLMDPLKELKGIFLLSMIDMSFPAGTVLSAIKTILKSYKEKSVRSTDVYQALKDTINSSGSYTSPESAKALANLHLWFNTPGYPLVNVNVIKAGKAGTVGLAMERFCQQPPCTGPLPALFVAPTISSKSDTRYYTPRQNLWITYNNSGTNANLNVTDGDWVIANIRSIGYYRAQYSPTGWSLILNALTRADNKILGRTHLLDDAFALAAVGALDYNLTLRLATANMKEKLFRNWFPVYSGLWQVRDKLFGLPQYSAFKVFASDFLQKLDYHLSNGGLVEQERSRIFSLFLDGMCEFNITGYQTFALSNLYYFLDGNPPTAIYSNNYDSLTCCGAYHHPNLTAQGLWRTTSTANSEYAKHFNSVALGCLSNYSNIAEVLIAVINADEQLSPHVLTTFQYLAETHPVELIASISGIARRLQIQLGAAEVAAIIVKAGQKINNTLIIPLRRINMSSVDAVVKAAAAATIASVSAKVDWLVNYNVSLVNALNANTNTSTNNTTSGATTTTPLATMLLLMPLLATYPAL